MTMDDDGPGAPVRATPRRPFTIVVLRAVVGRLRTDPFLCVPFVIAGLVVALGDMIRLRDPLPVGDPVWAAETVSVQYSLFPSGTARTTRELGALVDLQLPYLLGGLALEALVPLAVGTAGWVTVTRCLSADRTVASFARYVGGLVAVSTLLVVLPTRQFELSSLPVVLLAVVVGSLLVVRLFMVPGLLAAGETVGTALGGSVRRSRGVGVALFWLALALGVTSWGLASVPVVGGFLSTTVVGTVHAVALAVLLSRFTSDSDLGGTA